MVKNTPVTFNHCHFLKKDMIIIDNYNDRSGYTFTAHGDGRRTGDIKGPSQVHTNN